MKNKLAKFEENRQAAEENINAQISTMTDRELEKKSLLRLGAVGAIGGLAQSLA